MLPTGKRYFATIIAGPIKMASAKRSTPDRPAPASAILFAFADQSHCPPPIHQRHARTAMAKRKQLASLGRAATPITRCRPKCLGVLSQMVVDLWVLADLRTADTSLAKRIPSPVICGTSACRRLKAKPSSPTKLFLWRRSPSGPLPLALDPQKTHALAPSLYSFDLFNAQ